MKIMEIIKEKIISFFTIVIAINFFVFVELNAVESTKEFIKGKDTLIVYSDVPGLTASEFYTIKVRSAATNNQWVECFANITRSLVSSLLAQGVPLEGNKIDHYYTYLKDWSHTYANIEMTSGSRVEVEISSKNGFKIKGMDFTYANAHPAHRAEQPTVVNNKVYFIIKNPAQITIDINGQMDSTNTGNGYTGPPIHAVSFFANPIIDKPVMGGQGVYVLNPGAAVPANPATYTTLYFAPGVHNIGRNFQVGSNKHYYIPGDAIVYGTMNNVNGGGTNVRIYGYGSLSGDLIRHAKHDPAALVPGANMFTWRAIYGVNLANFRVEGLSIVNPAFHTMNLETAQSNQKETFCSWLKIVTWRGNGDGIGEADEIHNCFMRVQDDATYVKGDIIKGTVFWTDVNGAVFIVSGIKGDRPVVVEDCDVIYARHCATTWAGGRVFSKRGGGVKGSAKVNATFKDIRITDPLQTLETFALILNNGSYSGFTFRNIASVRTPSKGDNRILGSWDDITFDNVVLGGKRIASKDDFAHIDSNVTNLKFINLTTSIKEK